MGLEKIWEIASSKIAIIVYVVLLLVLVVLLAAFMIADEHRKPLIIKKGVAPINNKGKKPGGGTRRPGDIKPATTVTKEVEKEPTVIKIETEAPKRKDDKSEQTDESRFFMLTQLDEKYKDYEAPKYVNKIGLEELCNQFRNFMSYKLHLYYNISDIRRFIASLSVSKIMILQGMSGTGKTS